MDHGVDVFEGGLDGFEIGDVGAVARDGGDGAAV